DRDSCKLLLHAWYLDDGTVIGDSEEVAMRRAANAVDLMSLLPQLHDPQSLRGSIENIVVCGGPFFEDLQWSLASLPIWFGGLGLYSGKMVSSYAFVASRAQSWVLEAVY
ncbi:hypothetical protein Tco_1013342, partial [Tanacetum coccineum]